MEEERTALHNDLSEIDKEELAETDAGQELMRLSQTSIQQFGYARENPKTSLRRHNYDLLKQTDVFWVDAGTDQFECHWYADLELVHPVQLV